MNDRSVFLIVGVFSFLSPLVAESAGGSEEKKAVRVAQVQQRPVSTRSFVPGTVVSPDDAQVASEIAGKLVWVIEPGARVKAGAIIARLDTGRLKLALQDQRAEVRRLEAMSELRGRDSERQRKLSADNAGVEADRDRAAADFAMATQELDRAKTQLARIEDDLRRASLRAPFSGQIVERLLQAGEYVGEGASVARLVNTERVEILARVPVASAHYVAAGDRVAVRSGDERGEASVITMIQTGSFSNRSVTIRLGLPSEGPRWLLGSAVSVGVPTSEVRTELVVPRDALVLRDSGSYVIVIEDGKASRIGVELGQGDGAWIAVRGALRVGQTIVVTGAELIDEGDAVTILKS